MEKDIAALAQVEISIVIPARNEAEYLADCLAAIRRAGTEALSCEVIVVDNNSTDNTAEIARKFGCKLISSGKPGPGATRNAGASSAKGKFVAFIDADCRVPESWFSRMREYFESEDVVATGCKISPDFNSASWVEMASFHLNQRRGKKISGNAIRVQWLGTSNLMVRKEAFDKAGGFDENLLTCEDYDLCRRLFDVGKIILDTRIFVVHLREEKSLKMVFQKELHRGQRSLRSWIKGGFRLHEAPSLFGPLLFLLMIVAASILLFFKVKYAALVLCVGLVIPFAVTLRSHEARLRPALFIKCIAVICTYLIARGFALMKEAFGSLISSGMVRLLNNRGSR
jgi:glycosyltransferase involved in cell wall biosynthesis